MVIWCEYSCSCVCALPADTIQVFTFTTDLHSIIEIKLFPEIIYFQIRKAIDENELTYHVLKAFHTGKKHVSENPNLFPQAIPPAKIIS